jgi:hypothetical protein
LEPTAHNKIATDTNNTKATACATSNQSNGPPTILDSGTTGHFLTTTHPVCNKQVDNNPIAICNPNGQLMISSHTADLDLSCLPKAARQAHIVPDLTNQSLISIGQLCDAGCEVILDANLAKVLCKGKVILTGTRTQLTKLWHLNTPFQTAASASTLPHKQAEAVAFAHATLWSPALSTLQQALDSGILTTFPGLTSETLRKCPPNSAATYKGHLDQSRKNQRSTKPKPSPTTAPSASPINSPIDNTDEEPTEHLEQRTHHCCAAIIEPKSTIHTDLTGRFLVSSSKGNNCIFVLCDYDSNAISSISSVESDLR